MRSQEGACVHARQRQRGLLRQPWLDPRTPCLYDWYDEYPYDVAAWRTICAEAGGPVLDVACGTGRVAIDLAREGIAVHGVDVSPHMVARAREKLQAETREVPAPGLFRGRRHG